MRPSSKALIAAGTIALAASHTAFAETDPLSDPAARRVRESFTIERMALFDRPQPRTARGATCIDSAQPGLAWCTTATTYESGEGGTYSRTFGYNLDATGRVVYLVLTRREFPLARASFEETVKTLGARYGRAPATLTHQGKTADGDEFQSLIAVWGEIKLVRLSEAELRVTAQAGTLGRGPLVDHRQDVRLSARQREPVYKIEGKAGFIAEFRSVTDVRTDYVLRAVYPPGFAPDPGASPDAAPKFRDYPLDPGLAQALELVRAEDERVAAIERARRAEEERKAAEERARREEAERKAAEERRIAEEKKAAEEHAQREEAERKAAEERRIAEEKAAAARRAAEAKAAEERRIAEEKARREALERAAAEERARRTEAERKAAEARRLAEERARREEAERKAVEARRLAEERARREEAERRAAEERARLEEAERKAAAERRALEERARSAEAEYRASIERAQRAEAERKAAEERARHAESERKAAEERARRMEAERKAAEERVQREDAERRAAEARRIAEERERREEAERERRASEARRITEESRAQERRVAEERARRDEAERERRGAEDRRAAEEKKGMDEREAAEGPRAAEPAPRAETGREPAKPATAAPERPSAPPQFAGPVPGVGGPAPEANRDEWLRMAIAQGRNSPAHWVFERSRDRISDDVLLRTRALFPAGTRAALEIAFECNIGAGKRLAAHVRAFDERTQAAIAIPAEDGRSGVVRGGVTLDEDAPQTAFLFPERGERQASIVEIPLAHDDVRKNTPRAHAWLRHYRVVLKFRLAEGEATAAIYPYAENLRRVLEACAP